MNTEDFASLARLSPALRDTDGDFSARGGHRALRAEAVRHVRWLQRACSRSLTTQTSSAPSPIGATARARRTGGTEVHRQMGEDIPSWFDEGAPRVRRVAVPNGPARVCLADEVAESTRVHACLGATAVVTADDLRAKERP